MDFGEFWLFVEEGISRLRVWVLVEDVMEAVGWRGRRVLVFFGEFCWYMYRFIERFFEFGRGKVLISLFSVFIW